MSSSFIESPDNVLLRPLVGTTSSIWFSFAVLFLGTVTYIYNIYIIVNNITLIINEARTINFTYSFSPYDLYQYGLNVIIESETFMAFDIAAGSSHNPTAVTAF